MREEKFQISMTKDEMLKFYVNKIVEYGIKNCLEFENSINLKDYGEGIDLSKYKKEILLLLYKDERILDVSINEDLEVDMTFYEDYCLHYFDIEQRLDDDYFVDQSIEKELLEEFLYYYATNYLFTNPYIKIQKLMNDFAENMVEGKEKRNSVVNMLKKNLNETCFIEKHIEGIDVYITPKNYKELEEAIKESLKYFTEENEEDDEDEFE